MSNDSPNIIVRLLRGFWNALNFTRLLIFNLIFLVLVIAFFMAVFSSRPVIEPRTTGLPRPVSSPVSGSSGIWPEQKSSPAADTAWL